MKEQPIKTNASGKITKVKLNTLPQWRGCKQIFFRLEHMKLIQRHKNQSGSFQVLATIFLEESLNQIKEENQTNLGKRRVPKFFGVFGKMLQLQQLATTW